MITTIVFSRDRACQLDLLLRSIRRFAGDELGPTHVLYYGSTREYSDAYEQLRQDHPQVLWRAQHDFLTDTRALLKAVDTDDAMFMTDDSFVRAPITGVHPKPRNVLNDSAILCFSLRLGLNTHTCYPLRRRQLVPSTRTLGGEAVIWEWRQADGDFGYPGSLDAHVFRTYQLHGFLEGREYANPNQMEDALVAGCRHATEVYMVSYRESRVVSVPVNRVNQTHGNRFGENHPFNEQALNSLFLDGGRLDLDALTGQPVNGAHAELSLEFT